MFLSSKIEKALNKSGENHDDLRLIYSKINKKKKNRGWETCLKKICEHEINQRNLINSNENKVMINYIKRVNKSNIFKNKEEIKLNFPTYKNHPFKFKICG